MLHGQQSLLPIEELAIDSLRDPTNIDSVYASLSIPRWEAFSGETAVRLRDGRR